jgi:hypothetical protein
MPKRKAKSDDTPDPSPSLVSVLFGALFGVCLGASLALYHLSTVPVAVVGELPEAEDREAGKRYLILGADQGGGDWEAQRTRIDAGAGPISVAEAEANLWSRQTFRGTPQDNPLKLFEIADRSAQLTAPNFRFLADGRVQVNSYLEAPRLIGPKVPLTLVGQMEGGELRIEDLWLGSARIPPLPGLRQVILGRFRAAFLDQPDCSRLAASLSQASSVDVSERRLEIVWPG